MMRDAREKLLTLVNRATSPTDDDDNEARTAAVLACELLAKHPELVRASAAIAPKVVVVQAAPEPAQVVNNESTIHPDAERLLAWRAMLKKKSLREGHAAGPTLCADCGKPIATGDPIVELEQGPIATHLTCANWWWNFQPAGAANYDIAS
jgi:hypothetical protein